MYVHPFRTVKFIISLRSLTTRREFLVTLRNVYNDATTLQRHFGLTRALVRTNVRNLYYHTKSAMSKSAMSPQKSTRFKAAYDSTRGEPPQ